MYGYFFLFGTVHIYDKLDGLLKYEGNFLKRTLAKAQWECEKDCDMTPGCESFGFCPSEGCYLFDKITNKEDQLRSSSCYTVFRTCDKGKFSV